MAMELSRRSVLKWVGAAGAAGLTLGVIAPPSAEASLTIDDAVIDFGNQMDRVTIKCQLDGVVGTNPDGTKATPADFTITVTITDNRPGGVPHTHSRSPDTVR